MKKNFIYLISVFSIVLFDGITLNADEPVKPTTIPSKDSQSKNSSGTKEIPLDKNTKHGGMNDRQLYADVKAYLNTVTSSIDIYLYDTGETNIYILDSANDVVSENHFDSSFFPIVSIDAPDMSGKYWIIIDSEYVYAGGLFIK